MTVTFHPARVAAALLTVFFITTEVGAAPGDLDPKLGGFGAAGILGNPGFRVAAMAFDQHGRLVLVGTENDQFHVRRRSGNRFQIVEDVPILFQEVESQANHMAIDSEGRIVVVGYVFRGDDEFDFAVARLKPDLSLDETFGSGGLLAFEVDGTFNIANAVAIQSDNKIVVAGMIEASSGTSDSDWAIVRLHEDGTFDNSFDENGKKRFNYNTTGDEATAVAFQGDKILVAGGRDNDFGLARLNSDGSLDGTFGSAGDTQVGFGAIDAAEAMAIAPDGKIVLAGDSFDGTAVMAVARFSANGFPDDTFGGDGKVITSIGSSSSARAVDVQGDGKIVVAGSALLRYDDNGALDPAFGDGGIVLPLGGSLGAIVAQSDGNIVVGGFDVARYRWDGSLDTGGIAHLTFDPDHVGSEVTALAVGGDGKLVAVGKVFTDDYDAAMARFHADLVLDTTFGNETPKRGMTLFGSAGLSEELQSAAVEGDADVIAAGQVNSQNAGDNFLVARVKSDGMPDPACSADAFGSADFSGANDRATAVAIGPSSTIYAAGVSVAAGTGEDYGLMRFTSSCTQDNFGDMRNPYEKRVHLGGDEGAAGMVYQAITGRPVLVGTAGGNIVLIRLRVTAPSPGLELDPTFGVGGTAVLDTGGSAVAAGLAQLADGTLLVAGTVTNGPESDFLVARFTASGQLDNSFGVGGVGLASFHAIDTARSLDVRGDGTIAVAGITNAPDGVQFALAQFLPNGFLDPDFASLSGKTTLRLGELGEDVAQAVQFVGNNRVVVGGYSTVFGIRQFSLAAFTTTAETPTTTTTTTTLPDSACGDPVGTSGSGPDITASDALFILRAGVGSESCEPCVCDVNGSGSVSAIDALIALRIAVGQNVPLMCPAC